MGAGRREQSAGRRGVVPPAAEVLKIPNCLTECDVFFQVQDEMDVISTGGIIEDERQCEKKVREKVEKSQVQW